MKKRFVTVLIITLAAASYYCLLNRIFGYVCVSMIVIGLPCPGCGLTRAAVCLVKGDFAGSLRMNPMLLFIPVYFALLFLKKKTAADYYLIIIIIISFIVFGWRMARSFGTEPLVYNANSVINILIRIFARKTVFISNIMKRGLQ